VTAGLAAVTERLAILPFASGEVVGALRSGGAQIWTSYVKGERPGRGYTEVASLAASPVVAGGTSFVGNLSGRTVALATDTGTVQWTAADAAYSDIAVAGGSLFLVNDEARLLRLDAASGETVWSVELPYFVDPRPRRREAIFAHYGPVLAGGRLAVASSDGFLRFFSPTDGRLLGAIEVPGGAASSPVIAGGVLYVVGAGGQLHAFR
jgi:outer membrane protein assembly factor BamB